MYLTGFILFAALVALWFIRDWMITTKCRKCKYFTEIEDAKRNYRKFNDR